MKKEVNFGEKRTSSTLNRSTDLERLTFNSSKAIKFPPRLLLIYKTRNRLIYSENMTFSAISRTHHKPTNFHMKFFRGNYIRDGARKSPFDQLSRAQIGNGRNLLT